MIDVAIDLLDGLGQEWSGIYVLVKLPDTPRHHETKQSSGLQSYVNHPHVNFQKIRMTVVLDPNHHCVNNIDRNSRGPDIDQLQCRFRVVRILSGHRAKH